MRAILDGFGWRDAPALGDDVAHPAYYNRHPSGIECIAIARHMGFNLGNVLKYIWRADEKGAPVRDLEKAAWYLADEIAQRKKREAAVAVPTGDAR